MKLDKAIEILTLLAYQGLGPPTPDFKDAIKLGIKALTYIEHLCAYSIEHRQAWHRIQNPTIDTTRSEHTIKQILESPLGIEPKG